MQEVAELGKPHGIRGEITALLRGVGGDELAAIDTLRLRRSDGSEAAVRVTGARPKGGGWILQVDGVRDREAAEALRGAVVLAPRSDLPELAPGEWWNDDLVGLEVVSDEGESLGRLEEVLELPGNDVYVVRSDRGEILLPAIEDVIVAVELEEGKMTVHLLPGLVEGDRLAVNITVFTIFPELIRAACEPSILGAAIEKGILTVDTVDPREYTTDRHRKVDDVPFGGGGGMVMMAEPLALALDAAAGREPDGRKPRTAFLSPAGVPFRQEMAEELSREASLYLVCGRYKGIDDRVLREYATDEISIGDYVLSGGEIPALVVIDAVMRLLPGALGDIASAEDDSIQSGLLGPPEYTRPREFRGMEVPEVLVSGHHENVRRWRRREALRLTLARRPDLLERTDMSRGDREVLEELRAEQSAERGREARAEE